MRKLIGVLVVLMVLAGCQHTLEGGIETSGQYARLDGMVVSVSDESFIFTDGDGTLYYMGYDGDISQNDEVAVVYQGTTSSNSNLNHITGILGYSDTSLISMYLNVIDEIVLYDEIGSNVRTVVLDFDGSIALDEVTKKMISTIIKKRYSVSNVVFETYANVVASSRVVDGVFKDGAIFVIDVDDNDSNIFTLTKYHENLQHVAFGVKSSTDGSAYSYQITSATSNVSNEVVEVASESDVEEKE